MARSHSWCLGLWLAVALPFFSLIATQHEQSAFLDCGLTTRGGKGNVGACTCTPDGTGLPSGDGLVQVSLPNRFSPGKEFSGGNVLSR